MNYMEEHKEFFEKLLTMLEEQYGPDNEIVLHENPMTILLSISAMVMLRIEKSETAAVIWALKF